MINQHGLIVECHAVCIYRLGNQCGFTGGQIAIDTDAKCVTRTMPGDQRPPLQKFCMHPTIDGVCSQPAQFECAHEDGAPDHPKALCAKHAYMLGDGTRQQVTCQHHYIKLSSGAPGGQTGRTIGDD